MVGGHGSAAGAAMVRIAAAELEEAKMRDRSVAVRTSILAMFSVSMLAEPLVGAQPAGAQADPGWPRQYTDGTARLVLHQPQVDSWKNFTKLTARFATALTTGKNAEPVWGTLDIESETVVNHEMRTVTFTNFRITNVSYPSAKDEAQARVWAAITTKLVPAYPTSVALDRILAYMDRNAVKTHEAAVLLEPPPILVSTQPAVLVIIDGEPIFLDIEGTDLQKVVNTNWDLFLNKKDSRYYLRDDKVWLSAKDLTRAWTPLTKLPKDFSRLPATDQYKEIKNSVAEPPKPAVVKLVLVVHKPSELILINGEPSFETVEGTRLMWVTNSESDLFLDAATRQYYFLTSGRWFQASALKSGEWTSATTSLPNDFTKIPLDHPRAHVLAAVPGTRQADEAVVAASIPQTATIHRKSVKAKVEYIGEPNFDAIPGAGVSYATNTPNDVFRFEDRYYLCLEGVWLVAASAHGPWEAADKIPQEIYSIPPSSPKYNVTYVSVYESTPETVTYGYTAGYTGVYVDYGVAMWGTGYYYPPYYAYGYYPYPVYWPCPYYTYGASAWYNPATGVYGRGSAVYGPYGGYARGAAYNPANGRYAWGHSAWGRYGSAASGGFYNPATGGWGGSVHASNGYQSWGQSVVGRGGQYARTASYSGSRGTVGAIQTSGGGKAIAARGSRGQGFAGKSAAGDVYAGRDGNVYKRDQASGQWYKNNGGSWETVNRPTPVQGQESRVGQSQVERPSLGAQSSQGAAASREVQNGLNRDAAARSYGNYDAQRSEAARISSNKSNGWSSGGWTGQRSSGWSARSPSFGRRR